MKYTVLSTRANLLMGLLFAVILSGIMVSWNTLGFATTNSAPVASATLDTVGGLPTCIYYSGASSSGPDALVLTLPSGFVAREIEFVPDTNSDSNVYHWFYGMASGTGFSHMNGTVATGAAAGLLYHANGTANVNFTTATAAQITISIGAQVASQTYFARVCR